MISAKEMRKTADENYRIKKQEAMREVEEWMKEKDLEKMIVEASNNALYEVSVNTQSCPDIEIFVEMLEEAGYSYYRPFGGNTLKISWDEQEETE